MGAMSAKRGEQYAWAGFILLFVAATVAVMMNSLRSTLPPYRFAALNWIHGINLYDLSGIGGFTYFPQAAILIVPFALLPPMVGEVAWRLVNVAVFAFSL